MTQAAVTHCRMFVDGQFADTSGSKTIPVINPSNEEYIAEIPACTSADADAAVSAAEGAQKSWAKRPAIERAAYLHETRIWCERTPMTSRTH